MSEDCNTKPDTDAGTQKAKSNKMSTKGKFASAFFILCLTTVMITNQNCAKIDTTVRQRMFVNNAADPNNCNAASIDIEYVGRVTVGVENIAGEPTAFLSSPIPNLGMKTNANGNINEVEGATWHLMANPPTYRVEIPVDGLDSVRYEGLTNRLPNKVTRQGNFENRGSKLYGFDGKSANVRQIDMGNDLDSWLYYRNSRPRSVGVLVTSDALNNLPSQLKYINPNKEIEKCGQNVGHVALVMIEDEDENDNFQADNGVFVSLRLDRLID